MSLFRNLMTSNEKLKGLRAEYDAERDKYFINGSSTQESFNLTDSIVQLESNHAGIGAKVTISANPNLLLDTSNVPFENEGSNHYKNIGNYTPIAGRRLRASAYVTKKITSDYACYFYWRNENEVLERTASLGDIPYNVETFLTVEMPVTENNSVTQCAFHTFNPSINNVFEIRNFKLEYIDLDNEVPLPSPWVPNIMDMKPAPIYEISVYDSEENPTITNNYEVTINESLVIPLLENISVISTGDENVKINVSLQPFAEYPLPIIQNIPIGAYNIVCDLGLKDGTLNRVKVYPINLHDSLKSLPSGVSDQILIDTYIDEIDITRNVKNETIEEITRYSDLSGGNKGAIYATPLKYYGESSMYCDRLKITSKDESQSGEAYETAGNLTVIGEKNTSSEEFEEMYVNSEIQYMLKNSTKEVIKSGLLPEGADAWLLDYIRADGEGKTYIVDEDFLIDPNLETGDQIDIYFSLSNNNVWINNPIFGYYPSPEECDLVEQSGKDRPVRIDTVNGSIGEIRIRTGLRYITDEPNRQSSYSPELGISEWSRDPAVMEKLTLDYKNGAFYRNDVQVFPKIFDDYTLDTAFRNIIRPLCLFRRNLEGIIGENPDTTHTDHCINRLVIRNRADYYAAETPDGIGCLWDSLNNTYKMNDGEGSFIRGTKIGYIKDGLRYNMDHTLMENN